MELLNRRREMGSHLPYDYEVEYLESTGTQYIDTGIVPNINTEIETRVYQTALNDTDVVFGVRITNVSHFSLMFYAGKRTARADFGRVQQEFSRTFSNQNVDVLFTRKIARIGNYSVTLNASSMENIKGNLFIFALNRSDNNGNSFYTCWNIKAKMYYFKLYSGRNLLLDLIPVVKDNIGYLYDKVSGQLFGNAGTGQFIVGPRITSGGGYKCLVINMLCGYSVERRAA